MNNCTNTGDQSAPRAMKDVKVGDIVVNEDGYEALVLEVLTSTFLISWRADFEEVGSWYTFAGAETDGWKIKGEDTIIIIGGKKYKLIEE